VGSFKFLGRRILWNGLEIFFHTARQAGGVGYCGVGGIKINL
jgi:hypothetical protein